MVHYSSVTNRTEATIPTAEHTKLRTSVKDPELIRVIREVAVERRLPIEEVAARLPRREFDPAAIAEADGEGTDTWEQVKADMEQAREVRLLSSGYRLTICLAARYEIIILLASITPGID